MRLPVTPQLSTKDGISNKNARLTNTLKETAAQGEFAVVRPGLETAATSTGNAGGLVCFNGELISVYGATLGLNTDTSGGGTLSTISISASPSLENTAVCFIGASEFVTAGLDFDTEVAMVYVLDTGTNFVTDNSTGITTGNDVYAIASSGASVILATNNASGYGDNTGATLWRSALPSPLSFSNVGPSISQGAFDIVYADGKYVVAYSDPASNAYIGWSLDDGVSWSSHQLSRGGGRQIVFDGTSWWIYGWRPDAPPYIWAYSTIDFVTFSPVSFSGLPSDTSTLHKCAYKAGRFYMGLSDGATSYLYSSTDGSSFSLLSTGFYTLCKVSSGDVLLGKLTNDELSEVDGTTLSIITSTTFAGSYLDIDSNADTSLIVGASGSASFVRVDVSNEATIPTLATITAGTYDFAQSPL